MSHNVNILQMKIRTKDIDKILKIKYNNYTTISILSIDRIFHNYKFMLFGYNQGRIISFLAFTNSERQVVDEIVVIGEKGIFHGAVLARGRHLHLYKRIILRVLGGGATKFLFI